jgi:acyl-CoA dehydrogenase
MGTIVTTVDEMRAANLTPGSPESLEAVRCIAAELAKTFDRSYWLKYARQERFAPEQWQAFADSGLLRLTVPAAIGGGGYGLSEHVALMEAMAEDGVASHFLTICTIAQLALAAHGMPGQIDRYLRPTMTGELKPCMAITEEEAGTNIFRLSTTSRRTESGWVLNGEKMYITGADEADFMLIVARTPDEPGAAGTRAPFSLFLVDLPSPGLALEILEMDLGWPEKHCHVRLDNVQVPSSALVGEVNHGLQILWKSMNAERLIVPAKAIGLGRFALGKAITFARTRDPFGRPIGSYQAVQHPLALAEMHLRSARTAVYAAAARYDAGEDAMVDINIAKYLASEACLEAVNATVKVMGGRGFDRRYDVMSLIPIAHLTARGPINNEMILNFVAEKVLGLPRSY